VIWDDEDDGGLTPGMVRVVRPPILVEVLKDAVCERCCLAVRPCPRSAVIPRVGEGNLEGVEHRLFEIGLQRLVSDYDPR